MSRTERRGGDICSHYLNSFVGVNSIETLLLICINTHLPDTQKHVEQPVIHVFVLRFSEKQEFYPLLWSETRSAVHAKNGNRGISSGRV